MRIVLSLLIVLCLLGGTSVYTRFADRVRASAVTWEPTYSVGAYAIEIDRTFDCVPDDLFDDPALEVRFRGQQIYGSEGSIPASKKIRIENVQNIEVQQNDFNVTAYIDPDYRGLAAMRVRIFRDNALLKEATITDTAELGSISGSVAFYVKETSGDAETANHTHDANEGQQ